MSYPLAPASLPRVHRGVGVRKDKHGIVCMLCPRRNAGVDLFGKHTVPRRNIWTCPFPHEADIYCMAWGNLFEKYVRPGRTVSFLISDFRLQILYLIPCILYLFPSIKYQVSSIKYQVSNSSPSSSASSCSSQPAVCLL